MLPRVARLLLLASTIPLLLLSAFSPLPLRCSPCIPPRIRCRSLRLPLLLRRTVRPFISRVCTQMRRPLTLLRLSTLLSMALLDKRRRPCIRHSKCTILLRRPSMGACEEVEKMRLRFLLLYLFSEIKKRIIFASWSDSEARSA